LGRPRSARPEEVSRLLEIAYQADPDFAVLLWLAATTGARRGELCALRWAHVDLEAAELLILRNLFQAAGRLVEKDTKTHAARRLTLPGRPTTYASRLGDAPGSRGLPDGSASGHGCMICATTRPLSSSRVG
jgi:integrase